MTDNDLPKRTVELKKKAVNGTEADKKTFTLNLLGIPVCYTVLGLIVGTIAKFTSPVLISFLIGLGYGVYRMAKVDAYLEEKYGKS